MEYDAEDVVESFEHFQAQLARSNKTTEKVKMQLDQFVSSMETCERTVSSTRVTQRATAGTISVINTILEDIDDTLDGTKDQLKEAEALAQGRHTFFFRIFTNKKEVFKFEIFKKVIGKTPVNLLYLAQHSRHSELRSLYSQAMGALDKHARESEKVQFAARAAVETANRAADTITDSLELIRDLKKRLETFSSNDVLTIRDRIVSLRNSARDALEAARDAKNRALDLKVPDLVNTVDQGRVKTMANEIELQADVRRNFYNFFSIFF